MDIPLRFHTHNAVNIMLTQVVRFSSKDDTEINLKFTDSCLLIIFQIL